MGQDSSSGAIMVVVKVEDSLMQSNMVSLLEPINDHPLVADNSTSHVEEEVQSSN